MSKQLKILVADDDRIQLSILKRKLQKHGFEVVTCKDGREAKEEVERNPVDLVIADYMMPNMDGLELLDALRKDGVEIPFIIITAYGDIDSMMVAFKLGVTEYLNKPFDPDELVITVQKALNIGQITRKLSRLQEEVESKYRFEGLIGQSASMRAVFTHIHKSAQSIANVLISGETGTGKELIAKAIHYNGPNKNGPFIAANCAAFAEGTLESELFGHVKGAFTNAHRDHKGRFELADQGTLFLDEVGDIPLSTQIALLRVIQEKKIEQVGGQTTIHSHFRLIAATNKELKKLIKQGQFREDLYYRMSVINIALPLLRERKEDILLLIKYFLKMYSRINKKEVKTISIEALKLMQGYSWPGNVRQLENTVESAVAICDGDTVKIADLPLELSDIPTEKNDEKEQFNGTLPQIVEQVEKQMIKKALDQNAWVKVRAAKALGINERVLAYKMNKYLMEKE
jgi:two-component system NtrC family response regulator